MSFFDSEFVRSEMVEISELQEDIYGNVFKFPSMSKEEKMKHVEMLEKLLSKQQTLYTRLSLSDDPEAIEMKRRITDSAIQMGMPKDVDMSVIFSNMTSLLESMRKQIDITGSDL
jgi:hypothetical protein